MYIHKSFVVLVTAVAHWGIAQRIYPRVIVNGDGFSGISQTFSVDMAVKACNILKLELKNNVGSVAVGYPLTCTLWDNTSCKNGRLSTIPFDYYGQDPKFPNPPSRRTQNSAQSISCVEQYPTLPPVDGSVTFFQEAYYEGVSQTFSNVVSGQCYNLSDSQRQLPQISAKIANNLRCYTWNDLNCQPKAPSPWPDQPWVTVPWTVTLNYPDCPDRVGVNEAASFKCDVLA